MPAISENILIDNIVTGGLNFLREILVTLFCIFSNESEKVFSRGTNMAPDSKMRP